jgi:methionyl-tRNA formyltransferase
MAVAVFVGAYAYARQVLDAMPAPPMGLVTEEAGDPRWQDIDHWFATTYTTVEAACLDLDPDLVIVAGWRRLVPILAPTVGFHSAALPEYPGRAPVANAILRGDRTLTNTMLWLDEGVDTGDIIDTRTFPIGTDPDAIYEDIGRTSAEMLREHWQGLLDGTVPRTPQDPAKRGPLTPADAWRRLDARQPAWVEAFG